MATQQTNRHSHPPTAISELRHVRSWYAAASSLGTSGAGGSVVAASLPAVGELLGRQVVSLVRALSQVGPSEGCSKPGHV